VAALGYQGIVSSPTFTYVQIYPLAEKKRVLHFDLYRITSVDQFFELGLDEFLHDQEAYLLIEWPERIAQLLKDIPHAIVELAHSDDDKTTRSVFVHLNTV
jgi:tRNA threonylcarbamoyladenosine biosynthesis protein TsaE